MIPPTTPTRRMQELALLEQGEIPFRRLQMIQEKFSHLEPEVLQLAFRMLSVRHPWHILGNDTPALDDTPVQAGVSRESNGGEALQAHLRQPTAGQEKDLIHALISQVAYLRADLLNLKPSTREKLEFPRLGLTGAASIDRVSSILRAVLNDLKVASAKLDGQDSRRARRPFTLFVFTVANEVRRAGYEVSPKPNGALQMIIGIMVEDTPLAKDVDSSVRKAFKSWASLPSN